MTLYEFQKQYLEGIPHKYIFAAETGTGKTIMALEHYKRHAWGKPLLIVAPASKIATNDWQQAVKDVLTLQTFDSLLLPEIAFYSYEKFSRNPTIAQYRKTGDEGVWRAWAKSHPLGDYAVIADECHRMANSQSGIGKAMYYICKDAYLFIGLSATPLPNGWISAANYFKIFGFTPNITTFKKRYCNIATYKGFPEIVNYWHEGDLQNKWNSISKPLKKEEALDLPGLVTVQTGFETPKQYVQVLKQRIFEDKFLDNPSAYLHALRQSTMENKLPWLDEFLEGVSDNVVIFYNYRKERDAILAMIKKHHGERRVFLQDGENHQVPDKSTWDMLKRTITLAQYQSGSTGIEMTYAATTIYFSPTYSYVNYEQSVGRTYRNGQTQKCTFYLLCCPGTVEREIWSALKNKKDFDERMWYKTNIEEAND